MHVFPSEFARNRPFFRRALCVSVVVLAVLASYAPGQGGKSKDALTPAFCQRDPDAGFANDGRYYCAPTSISDGLIYLSRARELTKLVDGTGKTAQIDLIHKLAEEMSVDPEKGAGPERILTGLRSYVESRGYQFARLELATWRKVSAKNAGYKIAGKPDMKWMREAAQNPDCVMVFNNGWYQEGEDGYTRSGGHWVIVVGTGADPLSFLVHNPKLSPEDQRLNQLLNLTLLDKDFTVIGDSDEETDMSGYYSIKGPGLPFDEDKAAAAVLDAVIVFSLKK
ncbi:MAG: hypothetical protein KA419_02090 [Acidobacteria bacterium]|nr:hypothetical protein [Acidobacteriota bacterium]